MKKRIFLVFGIVLLTAILAYMVSGFLAQYLFVPILYILQIIWVFVGALPQVLWWGISLLVLLIIAFKSLHFGYERRVEQQKKPSYPISRASMWSNVIGRAENGEYSLWLLANQLTDFTMELLAHRERISKEQSQNMLLNGAIDLPPNIKSFLLTGSEVPSFRHYADLISRSKTAGKPTPLKIDLYEIVEFLESNF